MRQLVERLDGRRALRGLEALVCLRGDVRAARHLALLLAPARLEEFVRNLDSRGKLDRVELLVTCVELMRNLCWYNRNDAWCVFKLCTIILCKYHTYDILVSFEVCFMMCLL